MAASRKRGGFNLFGGSRDKPAPVIILSLIVFLSGLVLFTQGWMTWVKVNEAARGLNVDRATVAAIRQDVDELGANYKKSIIEQKYGIKVGRTSLRSIPAPGPTAAAPWLMLAGVLLVVGSLFVKGVPKYVLTYGALLVTVFPFFWMVLASFKNNVDIIDASKGMFNFAPTFKNYVTVFNKYNFLKPTANSFYVALMSTGIGLVFALPAAYVIARYKLYKLSLVVLTVRMIPGITFLVPWYMLFMKMGITNTFTALILSHLLIALPFIIWIMVPYFENVPHELEEAAWVDGNPKWATFLRIVLPVSVPGIMTAALLAFIFSWNNFMFSLTLSGANTTTLPIAIYGFVGYASVDWGGLMAAAVFITLPIVILSLMTQKYIISGLTAGAVKG